MAMSRCCGATLLTTRSPTRIRPSDTFSRPASMRRAVVLPQPDGPTSTMNSPSATSSRRSLTAAASPKVFVTWSYVTLAISSGLSRRVLRQREMGGNQERVRDRQGQERQDRSRDAHDVHEQERECKPEEAERPAYDRERRVTGHCTQGASHLEDGERPEGELEDAEHEQEVEANGCKGPGPGSCPYVEGYDDGPDRNGDRKRGTQHDSVTPMPAQPVRQFHQPEVVGLAQSHYTVHDRHEDGADQNGQHDRGTHGQGREHHREHGGAQEHVQHHQPPGLVIEVVRCDTECPSQSHPFTPAEATPATKYRWKTTKITRMGRMAMTLAAMSGGHIVK